MINSLPGCIAAFANPSDSNWKSTSFGGLTINPII